MIGKLVNSTRDFVFVQNKSLLKNIYDAGLYLSGSIVQAILSIIAQPIYSKYLSSEEFGIIGYFLSIQNIFTPLFILGITSVYLMKYFKQSESDNKKLLFNLTFYLFCINILCSFIGYYLIYSYFKYSHVIVPLNPFAWFIFLTLLLNNIKSIVLINFRIRKKALSFFTFTVTNSLLNFVLGILFVAFLKWGAEGRMLAPIISIVIMLPLCFISLRKDITVNFNFSLFLKAAKLALPLVLAAYAFVPIVSIDIIFLERLNNLSELGLYNIGISIAGYTQLAFMALMNAFEPDIYKCVAEVKINRLIMTALVIYIPFSIFILVLMTFSHNIISILTSGRYLGAEQYMNITFITVFLLSIFSFLDKIFIALGKTKLNLLINIICGIISIIIMYLATTNYAFLGAAWGKVIIGTIMVIFSFSLAYINLKKEKLAFSTISP